MKTKIQTLVLGLVLLGAIAITAQAQSVTLFDNLAYAGTGGAGNPYGISGFNCQLADSFSTLSTPVTLTEVSLMLQRGSATTTGSTTIGLYADNGTSPGSLLAVLGTINDATLSYAALDNNLTQYDFSTSYSLAANTRYWIGINAPLADNVGWGGGTDASGIGASGEYYFFNGPPAYSDDTGPFSMAVQTSPSVVPEPSTLALAGLGGASLLIRRRRK